MTYNELNKKINKDVSSIKIDHKKLKPHELSVYNLIIGRSSIAQFNVGNEVIMLQRGDYAKGLMHILDRHHCECCDGWVTAKNIIYMGRVFYTGRKMTDYEVKDEYTGKSDHFHDSYDKGKEGYVLLIDGIRHFIIYAVDHADKNKKIITYYTDRINRCKEDEEIIAEPVALH